MATDRWIQRWYVSKSTGDGQWCVALDRDGMLQLSCVEIQEAGMQTYPRYQSRR